MIDKKLLEKDNLWFHNMIGRSLWNLDSDSNIHITMFTYTHKTTREKTKKIDNFEKKNKREILDLVWGAILDSLIRLLLLQQSLSSLSSSF